MEGECVVMMIDKTNKRLMSVKETYPLLFQKQCSCCGNNYIKEKMYKVHRWGVNKTGNEEFSY